MCRPNVHVALHFEKFILEYADNNSEVIQQILRLARNCPTLLSTVLPMEDRQQDEDFQNEALEEDIRHGKPLMYLNMS